MTYSADVLKNLKGTQCCDPSIDGILGAAIEEIERLRAHVKAADLKLATIEMRLGMCTGRWGWDEALAEALVERQRWKTENEILRKAIEQLLEELR